MKERHLDFSVNAVDEFELGVSPELLDGKFEGTLLEKLQGISVCELERTSVGKLEATSDGKLERSIDGLSLGLLDIELD